jgi:hypothetical protein
MDHITTKKQAYDTYVQAMQAHKEYAELGNSYKSEEYFVLANEFWDLYYYWDEN